MKPVPMKERYGRWTVLDPAVPYAAHDKVPVGCDCGTVKEVVKNALTQGRSTSCGCRQREALSGALTGKAFPDLAPHRDTEIVPGARFGRWKALTAPYASPGRRDAVADCRCECGSQRAVVAHALLSGKSKSCGCLRSDGTRLRNQSVSRV